MRRFARCFLLWAGVFGPLVAASNAQAGYRFVSIQGPGSADTEPIGISNDGTITGYFSDANGNYHGFSDRNGSLTQIDVPSSLKAQATFLYNGNSLGQITGAYVDGNGIFQGAIYNAVSQSWTYLTQPDPSSKLNAPGAITNSGIVFGNWSTDPSGLTALVGYVYQNGVYTSFIAPGSNAANGGTFTAGANNAGTLVGFYVDDAKTSHGFLRSLGGTFSTFDVPNERSTQLLGINDNGELVGRYRDFSGILHGFTYLNGVVTTVDFPGEANTVLTGVNNNGDLVGITFTDGVNGPIKGFVAFSVPEPSSIALVVAGVGLVTGAAGLRRRCSRD